MYAARHGMVKYATMRNASLSYLSNRQCPALHRLQFDVLLGLLLILTQDMFV